MFVLSNGSIKQQFATSLAAALLLSGIGAAATGAHPLSDVPESKESATAIASSLVLASNRSANGPNTGTAANQSDLRPTPNVIVHAHEIDGRRAATLYVKNIPILTFIGTEVGSLSNSSDAVSLAATNVSGSLSTAATPAGDLLNPNLELDPILRASTLGEKLDSGDVDASKISVRWNEESKGYIVTLADGDLISLDARTVLPDTTSDAAEDALQVTNRLRRLIGSAEPVSEIEGLPEPEPVVAAPPVQQVAIISSNIGSASWYGPGFDGRLSASGEVFNQYAMTAAHRTLPFGTRVLVTNLYNGRQVTVRINDRGPYSGGRIIDLSAGAADAIGLTSSGVGTVQLDVLAN
ncbi:MAG: septal ring lytic transglycosylase RlpA family protein [Phormidesmis sp.]